MGSVLTAVLLKSTDQRDSFSTIIKLTELPIVSGRLPSDGLHFKGRIVSRCGSTLRNSHHPCWRARWFGRESRSRNCGETQAQVGTTTPTIFGRRSFDN